jgi:hypothetical protein
MEARIKTALSGLAAAEPSEASERMEHLAILKRWYYRGTRVGEIFFGDSNHELPMRRIVRGISRVYRGEAPETSSPAAPEAQLQSKRVEDL